MNILIYRNTCFLKAYSIPLRRICKGEIILCENIKIFKCNKKIYINSIEHEYANKDECVICFEKIDNRYACIPCGHSQFCERCILNIDKNCCPMCRTKITQKIRIF